MKPASSGVKLTYDDFVLFPDDGKRHELIDGAHYVTPSPNVRVAELLLDNGDVLSTPLLPGLEMPLSRIFRD